MKRTASPRRQDISFVQSRDGTRIAVASIGHGPPLVCAAHWLGHVSRDMDSPVWRPWIARLSQRNTVLRYDLRGCGLSERTPGRIDFDAWCEDLEAVAAQLDGPFTLLGMSQGAALAITYARRHPERVAKLVLIGGYGRGLLARDGSDAARIEAETLANLMQLGWGIDGTAFSGIFTQLFVPGGTPEQVRWWKNLERQAAAPDIAVRTLQAMNMIDVLNSAAQLDVPTLVLHSRRDARVPFDEGLRLAAAIPGARLVVLESANHVLLDQEGGWESMWQEIEAFLATGEARATTVVGFPKLSPAENDVLTCLAAGLSNAGIAERLGKSEKTVRNQVSVILGKLGVGSRAEAIVQVLSAGQGQIPPR